MEMWELKLSQTANKPIISFLILGSGPSACLCLVLWYVCPQLPPFVLLQFSKGETPFWNPVRHSWPQWQKDSGSFHWISPGEGRVRLASILLLPPSPHCTTSCWDDISESIAPRSPRPAVAFPELENAFAIFSKDSFTSWQSKLAKVHI